MRYKNKAASYLLKPIREKELVRSIDKYQDLTGANQDEIRSSIEALLINFRADQPYYKSRFLVKIGERYKMITTDVIAYIGIEDHLVQLTRQDGEKFIVDHSLDKLEKQLDPERFFRINRQMVVTPGCIGSIHTYTNSRLQLILQPPVNQDVIVSREKVGAFKRWLDK